MNKEKIIKFSSDTKHRKQWFTGISFSHPAKMSLPLQFWIIDNFTQEGDTILDPMAGSGTILVACSMGRNVITVELEDKFVQMEKDNWERVKQRGCQLGYSMGTATILQGDARNLEGLLVDKCVFSPPYSNEHSSGLSEKTIRQAERIHNRKYTRHSFTGGEDYGKSPANISNLPYGEIDKIVTSPPYAETLQGSGADAARRRIAEGKYKGLRPDVWISKGNIAGSTFGDGYSRDPDNLSNLPYGSIDAVISSPPYEEAMGEKHHSPRADKLAKEKSNPVTYTDKVDAVISSPPYEETMGRHHATSKLQQVKKDWGEYSIDSVNIGNLKGETYLSAMLLVYQNCFAVLKDSGLMILVTKNFIRNKKQVRLDLDTIKLCEQVGFTHIDSYQRKLPAQSFWRTIYYQKYPDVKKIEFEDILIFGKSESIDG